MTPFIDQPIDAPKANPGAASEISGAGASGAVSPVSAIFASIGEANAILNFARVIVFWAARGIMMPAELVFRKRIGERYHSGPIVLTFLVVMWVLSLSPAHVGRSFVGCTIVVTLALWIIRARVRLCAQRKGIYWHSYSEGESILTNRYRESLWRAKAGPFSTFRIATSITEPLVLLLTFFVLRLATPSWDRTSGLIDWLFAAPWASYFLIAAVVSALYQSYCWRLRREQMLDHLDAEVMMEAHARAMKPHTEEGLWPYRGAAYIKTKSKAAFGD